jgi:hypothetical protein
MKDIRKKLLHSFTYVIYLLVELFSLGVGSFMIYWVANGHLFIVYVGNVLFIICVLAEEKLLSRFSEKLHHKLKKDGFIKRYLKKSLANISYTPSVKVILYVYYLICIVAERLLYFGVAKNVTGIASYKEYLSIMYYSFIFLIALDKVMQIISKESESRKKNYAKYEES